jgi:hypothetical protein
MFDVTLVCQYIYLKSLDIIIWSSVNYFLSEHKSFRPCQDVIEYLPSACHTIQEQESTLITREKKILCIKFKSKISRDVVFGDLDPNNKSWKISTNFERQIPRKIFGPVNIDNIWRIRNDMKIDKLIEGASIVRFMKAQRINP